MVITFIYIILAKENLENSMNDNFYQKEKMGICFDTLVA